MVRKAIQIKVLKKRFWRIQYRFVETRNHRLSTGKSEDVSSSTSTSTSTTTSGDCPNIYINLYTKLTKSSARCNNSLCSPKDIKLSLFSVTNSCISHENGLKSRKEWIIKA